MAKPERIQPSTSPLADQNTPPPQKPARVGGKFVKRTPITPVAQQAHQQAEAEALAAAQALDAPVVQPKNTRRKERRPFGRQEAKLTYPPREGFTRRFFNDDPGRVERALDAGYTHVVKDSHNYTRPGGTNKQGGGRTLFLMEIPTEFYDEDFAAKNGALDETDNAIYTGHHNKEAGDGRYVVKTTPISVGVRRGPGSG